eukprot:569082-Rhodomonas_salina.1
MRGAGDAAAAVLLRGGLRARDPTLRRLSPPPFSSTSLLPFLRPLLLVLLSSWSHSLSVCLGVRGVEELRLTRSRGAGVRALAPQAPPPSLEAGPHALGLTPLALLTP